MDVEVDPLKLKDPLDFCPDAPIKLQDSPTWNVPCEGDILLKNPLETEEIPKAWKSVRIKKPRMRWEVLGDNSNSDEDDDFVCDYKKTKKRRNKKRYVTSECNKERKGKVEEEIDEIDENLDDLEKTKESVLSVGKTNFRNVSPKSNRKHQCLKCPKTFITLGHLKAHMICHSDKKWKCEGCGKDFSCERSLVRHRSTFPGEHWFPCQHCDMNFFRVKNILKHLEIKHPEAYLEAKETGELILFSNEKKNNLGQKKEFFICIKCLELFYYFSALKAHKEISHSCKNSENMEEGDEIDLMLNNNYIPKYKCDICFKEFVSLEGYEYHINNQHLEESEKLKKSKVSVNNKIISDQKDEAQESEKKEKEEDENLICKICLQTFLTKMDLQIHMRSHSTRKNVEAKSGSHQCCICPKSFASSDGLKYHLATHTGERRYSCSQCGKKFIKKTHLHEHIATHSRIKCFKCSRCPRTFSTHSAYRKHAKLFPGPHSFPCTKCGKIFTKESMLEKHICVDLVHVTMAPEIKALLSEEKEKFHASDECHLVSEQRVAGSQSLTKCKSDENPNTSSHSCYKCFKIFATLDDLQNHQYEHLGKQQYQCRFCPESFKRADDFSSHIRFHLGSSPYMCLKCNRKFISPLTLSMHAKKYPGEHSFTCSNCQRWFPSEKKLEKHECLLQNAEVFICACKLVLKNWNEFRQHAGMKPYKCCACDLKYLTLISLARHIKKHTGVKPFSCETCGKSFQAKTNYLNHLKVHEESKVNQCEHCDFKSKSKKRLDFHLFRKHDIGTNSSSTLCPVCGIIFPYISQMKRHIETEHANVVVLEEAKEEKKALPVVLCTLCGKLLSNKYMLANHMKKIHDPEASKNNPEYQCEVCKVKFQSKKRLERHSSIHEDPSPRICKICSREFLFAKDLRKHMKRHDTSKPFSCPKCGKNFKVSVSLKYHSSICGNEMGNVLAQGTAGRIKQVNLESNILVNDNHVYYGYVDPLVEKNCVYSGFATYPKWNQLSGFNIT